MRTLENLYALLALADFFFADAENGEEALPALIAAQRRLAASAIAFRPATLSLRLRRVGALVEAGGRFPSGRIALSAAARFLPGPGGRPRRLTEPWRASIAPARRSRSIISKATICSVCMNRIVTSLADWVQETERAAGLPRRIWISAESGLTFKPAIRAREARSRRKSQLDTSSAW